MTGPGAGPAASDSAPSMPTYVGMPAFPDAAATALGDAQLRRNLAHATSAIRVKRAGAVAELADWQQLRAAGKAIKDHTLAHLDTYLTRLEQRVTDAGGHVHWAQDAAEVRDIFLAGMPDAPEGLTDQPADLAAAARTHLRRAFLSAKVGISGANFAIAETGTLVVVESEGNGRMCLTLPETLISVVGIEKVLPAWRDLEVFLALLPRSSTAERMNPYTSTWTGVQPGDGPREFHLVLLDNGRTSALADPTGRQALRCIRCSACLNVCPVYERVGGHAYGSPYPGPIGAIITPQLRGLTSPADASLPYASTLCGACYDVCPVAINIPAALVHLRGEVVEKKRSTAFDPERIVMRQAAWVLRSGRRLGLAQRAASASRMLLGRSGRIRRLPPPLSGWTKTRDAPAPPPESFRAWWARTHGDGR